MTPSDGAPQVLRNAGHLLLAYVLPRAFTVASVVVAARWLGADRFGAYGAAAALAVMSAALASAGMMPLLVRELARSPARAPALLASADRIKLVTSTLMVAFTWLLADALLVDEPEARAAATVMSIGWAAQAFAENGAAYFQAVERMRRWTQASALFGVVSAVVGVALLIATDSIVAYCAGFTAGWVVAWAWLRAGLPADVRAGSPDDAETRLLLHALIPFAAGFLGLAVYCKIDVLLLQRWSSTVEVGLYTAAYKFIDVFQAMIVVAAGAIYPRLSRRRAGLPEASRAGSTAAEVLLLGAVPVGIGLHLVAGPVTAVLFGAEYAAAAPALARLAVLMPMLALTILGGYVLGAAGRMSTVAGLYAVGLAVNVALNAGLVPTAGATGAATARLGSEALLVTGFLFALAAVGAAPSRRVVATAVTVVAAGIAIGRVPDPSGGFLRAGAFAGVVVLAYAVARVVSVPAVLDVVRRATPAERAEAV